MSFLTGGVIKFIFSVFCRFHRPKSLCLLTVPRLLGSHHLVQILVIIEQRVPFLSFDSLVNGLATGVPVRIILRWSPTLKVNMVILSACLWKGSTELRFYHPDRFGTVTQAAHSHCVVVVHFDETPEYVPIVFVGMFCGNRS